MITRMLADKGTVLCLILTVLVLVLLFGGSDAAECHGKVRSSVNVVVLCSNG